MKVEKKNLPKQQLELVVTLEVAELQPYLDQAAKKISNEVKIPGFRAGHVPYDVLKKNVGEATIYEEAFYKAVDAVLPKIILDEKIEFVGQPSVDVEKVAPNNPLVFKAIFGLMPTVTLGDYKTLKTKKTKVQVNEKKVEQALSDIQKMRAQEKLVDRAAKKSDKVEIDFDIKLAGVAIENGHAHKYPLVLGDNKFIPGFEEQVIGLKKDQEKDFKITFPKEYHDKNVAGRECDVYVKVVAVYEVTLPKRDDEFAKGFNFESWAILEKQIRDNIQKELENKEQEKLELAILEEIIAKSQFSEFPDQLLELETKKMMHELEHSVEDAGGKMEDYLKHIKKTEEELKKELQPQTLKRIQTALVAKAVSLAEKIKVEPTEIDKELDQQRKAYAANPEMEKQLNSDAYRRYLENILLNKKTFEKLESFIKE